MNKIDPIKEELRLAGEVSQVTPMLLKLDRFRIMSDTDVPSEEFLLRLFGKPCFPRRDLSVVTGTEKCGKTFFTTMLMACCAEKRVLELERIGDEPLKVMWYDTEQSRQTTKSILTDRIFRLTSLTGDRYLSGGNNAEMDLTGDRYLSGGNNAEMDLTGTCPLSGRDADSRYFVFNVRACTCQERLDYLVTGIETYRPDMVIIDNVSDLLSSINDPEESTRVIDQLMQLSTEYDCNITIVIHLNRTGEKRNLRGWLGTEILHKAFDVYYCQQIEKTEVFSVEQTFTRKYRVPEEMYYKIDENGLPQITVKPDFQPRDSNGQYKTNKPEAYQIKTDTADKFNQKYIIHNDGNARQPWEWDLGQLFNDALSDRPSLSLEALQNEVMSLSGIKQPKYYDKVFNLAVGRRIVQTTMDKHGRVVAILPPSLPNPLLL